MIEPIKDCQNDPIDFVDPNGHWILDALFLVADVAQFVCDPSVENALWIAGDIVSFADPTGAASTAAHAIKAVKIVSKTVKVINKVEKGLDVIKFVKEGGRMVESYKNLTKILKGTGLEAHHLLEARFAQRLGLKESEMLSVALTKEQHQAYTNLWRKYIPYGTKYADLSRDYIIGVAKKVYKDAPELLAQLEKSLK